MMVSDQDGPFVNCPVVTDYCQFGKVRARVSRVRFARDLKSMKTAIWHTNYGHTTAKTNKAALNHNPSIVVVYSVQKIDRS